MNAARESLLEQILIHTATQGAQKTISLLQEELSRLIAVKRILERGCGPTPAAQLVAQEHDALVGEIKTLQANLDIAVEALRFYAEHTTYLSASLMKDGFSSVRINGDKGQRARDALATLVSSCPVNSIRDEGQSDG